MESDFYPYAPSDLELKRLGNKKEIFYEDALLLVYLKGLLEGFFYDTDILQVVIDEAQDYSFLQYKILQKIFKKTSFTILGDVNQTINPYYYYDSLEILNRLWNSKYIELNKTYRSSPEIISYANNILHLNHVSAIQKKQNKPVIVRSDDKYLFKDIDYLLKTHKSVAIITHDDIDAKEIYEKVCNDYDVTLLLEEKNVFKNDFIIIPAYLSKGLEFESVLVYQNKEHYYNEFEKNLYYVSVTRAQHELIVYQS